ncbi:hypothetical protein HN747_01145 [archaeon]|nr:hypothetical protein [archaeon]
MKIPKPQSVNFNDQEYSCAYKVVRSDMTSLGLRNNPTPMKFYMGNWIYLPEGDEVEGISDYGGIWLARTKGRARSYKKYMANQHGAETRVFLSLIDRVLFINQDRVKTNGLRLIEELDISI